MLKGRPRQAVHGDDYRASWATHVRGLIDRKGWHLAQFTERLNVQLMLIDLPTVTPATVTRWLNGNSEPNLNQLPALAATLGTTVPKLFPTK